MREEHSSSVWVINGRVLTSGTALAVFLDPTRAATWPRDTRRSTPPLAGRDSFAGPHVYDTTQIF
jgi:hypothetical protein